MRARLLTTLAAVALAAPALPAQTIAITGGRVFPVSGAPIDNGTVIIRDGQIVAVGSGIAIPAGAQRIDATGKWVTPGLFNPSTLLGLVEVSAVPETRQPSARNTDTDRIHAALRVWESLNPASVLFAAARNEGVTTVMIHPVGGLVSGQAAVIDVVDGSMSEMLVRAPVAMVAQVGDAGSAASGSRGELLLRLRELLDDTRAYQRNRAGFERAATREFAASRSDLEAMIPVLEGRLLLIIGAEAASDIEAALDLARQYNMRIAIGGGSEAWRVADKLAAARVPVFAGALNNIPGSFATLGARQENPGLLRRAGVEVLLIGTGSDPDAFNVRNIRQEAGNAVAYGMSWDDALRSITLAPAQLFGIADRVGSLQAGRTANVVVWSGDPFEFATQVEHVIVRGRVIREPSRQDMLMQRYRTLPPDYTSP
ncbi:MAG: amidohydrolase family protein [Gemmatimonadaceae bacterium]|nr:amidohydrolase family protein [Gemmatimonadaceae bacterium]